MLVLRLALALSLELMLEQVLALELGMELTPALVTEPACLPEDGGGRLELLPAVVLELGLLLQLLLALGTALALAWK